MSSASRDEMSDGGIYGLRYSSYEDPRSFEPYQLLLLGIDFILNWVMDWAHTDPLAILVIFVFQCLGLVVNLIIYIMASASQAMQSGLRKSLVHHHEINLITCVTYIALTCSWYIWALRKSWPSVSDQFSFSFSGESEEANEGQNDLLTTLATTTTTTTMGPILSTLVTQSVNKTRGLRRFLRHGDGLLMKESMNEGNNINSFNREFYTLWSPGFVALYAIHRTVAIIHYVISLKATYLLLNVSTIDNLDRTKYPGCYPESTEATGEGDDTSIGIRTTRTKRISERNAHGNLGKNGKSRNEEDFSDIEINERRQKNFRNNSQILWGKKQLFLSTSSEPQNSSAQDELPSSSAHLSREISLSPTTRVATTGVNVSNNNSNSSDGGERGGGDGYNKTKRVNNRNPLLYKRSALGEVKVGSHYATSDLMSGIMG